MPATGWSDEITADAICSAISANQRPSFINQPINVSAVKGKTRQSRRLPYWLWFIIAKSLGIRLVPHEKPIVASVLYLLTLASAFGLFFTNSWFCGYSVESSKTMFDMLDATVAVLMTGLYCGLGVYTHRLAFRLFVHPKFLDMMRLHAKTIVKINAALVILVIGILFIIFRIIYLFDYMVPYKEVFNSTMVAGESSTATNLNGYNPCQIINIPVPICWVYFMTQAIFSFFFLMWNVLVAVMLVSVARTHTIAIRQFIQQLEVDASLRDEKIRQGFSAGELPDDDASVSDEDAPSCVGDNLRLSLNESADNAETPNISGCDLVTSSGPQRIMNEHEIMYRYWRLATQVRLTSSAFQRWMCSITCMILLWSSICLVYWLSHSPTLYGIFSFILPLLLLPLITSSYAEVNYEADKVIQSIMPTNRRTDMFQYLYGIRIQMTAYGHAISYGTMGTVFAAILAAFASKILIGSVTKFKGVSD